MQPGSLAARLYSAEGLLALVCVSMFAALHWSLERRDRALQDLGYAAEFSRASQWAGLSCRRYLEAVLGPGGKQGRADGKAALATLRRTRTAAGHLGLGEEAADLEQLGRFVQASDVLLRRIEHLRSRGRPDAAASLYRTGVIPLADEYLGRSLDQAQARGEERSRRAFSDFQAWLRLSLACAAAGVGMALLLFALWTRRLLGYVTRHMEQIRRALGAIGSGNFELNLRGADDDEVGRLHTALGEMAERLKHAQRRVVEIERLAALGQLANGAAHAINNPLAAVLGYTDLALQREDLAPAVREDLRVVREQARRCDVILRNLRQFAAQGSPEKRPLALNELLQRLMEFVRPTLEGAHVLLDLRMEARLPAVSANAYELQQVFFNLITNATQAVRGRAEPRITVSTWSETGQVVAAVDDNGEGILPENLPRIFEPFFTTRSPAEGLGLGLSSAYGIVQNHGGEIRVRSEPGRGTRLEVRLPAVGAPPVDPSAPPLDRARVLVVDDEAELLTVVSRVLRREGFEVECVHEPALALRAATAGEFDVILSDYRMAGMDGIQLCEAINSAKPGAAARFIFSTGEIVSRDFQEYADRRGIPVLLKPFDLQELVGVVRARLHAVRAAKTSAPR